MVAEAGQTSLEPDGVERAKVVAEDHAADAVFQGLGDLLVLQRILPLQGILCPVHVE